MARPGSARHRLDADIIKLERKAAEAAEFLRLLANENRLLVLCQLAAAGEMSVGTLASAVRLSQSALSQHLAKLREEELVLTRREAQTIYYSLSSGPAKSLLAALYDIYCGPGAKAAGPSRRKG